MLLVHLVGEDLTDEKLDEAHNSIEREFFAHDYTMVEFHRPMWVDQRVFPDGNVVPSHWTMVVEGR